MATLFGAVWQVSGVLRSCDMCFVNAITCASASPMGGAGALEHLTLEMLAYGRQKPAFSHFVARVFKKILAEQLTHFIRYLLYHQNMGYFFRAARLLAARASTSMHVAPAAQGSRTYQ